MATVIDAVPFSGFNAADQRAGSRGGPERRRAIAVSHGRHARVPVDSGIKIIEGRPFTDADERGPLVVIVNQAMARACGQARARSASASGSDSIRISILSSRPDLRRPTKCRAAPSSGCARHASAIARAHRQRSASDAIFRAVLASADAAVCTGDRSTGARSADSHDIQRRRPRRANSPHRRGAASQRPIRPRATRVNCSIARCGRGSWGRRCSSGSARWRLASRRLVSMRVCTRSASGGARWRFGSRLARSPRRADDGASRR